MNVMTRGAKRNTDAGTGVTGAPNIKTAGFLGGLALFAAILLMPAPEAIGVTGWRVLACAALMLVWWLTEALPLGITGLVPIALFVPMGISGDIQDITSMYGHRIIFLFLGGFMIGIAMQKWHLHERIALMILSRIGGGACAIIGGSMIATAGLSMWMSNTATTLMMLPIALSMLQLLTLDEKVSNRFAVALLLSVAFAANIGGTATIIGTPPNAVLASFLSDQLKYDIQFLDWFLFAAPFAAVMLAITWFIITRVFGIQKIGEIPGARQMIADRYKALGAMSREELYVSIVFVTTAALWLFKKQLPLPFKPHDTMIAIAAGISLFLLPASGDEKRILGQKDLARIPWGVLLMFGGGLNLAAAMSGSGLTAVIGEGIVSATDLSNMMIMLVIVFAVLMLTETMGNVALITAMLPVIMMVALSTGIPPIALMAGATLASSCAFMLPMGTPPNAIVFASGRISMPQMAKTGLALNIIASLIIWGMLMTWAPRVFGG